MGWGRVIKGVTGDCNRKELERALKAYDPQLYTKWNPDKLKGLGTWEVRRLPNSKIAVPKWELGNQIVFELEYVETNVVNHVMDLPALTFRCLDRLREMDTWKVKNWVQDLEAREKSTKEIAVKKNREELRYAIKQNKTAIRDFYEGVRSGKPIAEYLEGEW